MKKKESTMLIIVLTGSFDLLNASYSISLSAALDLLYDATPDCLADGGNLHLHAQQVAPGGGQRGLPRPRHRELQHLYTRQPPGLML